MSPYETFRISHLFSIHFMPGLRSGQDVKPQADFNLAFCSRLQKGAKNYFVKQ
jgi:hypothetical protein